MDFKVGDIVRGIKGNDYGCTSEDMTKGEVVTVCPNKFINIKILEHNHPEQACCGIEHTHINLDPKQFELIPDRPRICEVTGLNPLEQFNIAGFEKGPYHFNGEMSYLYNSDGEIRENYVPLIINHPEKIIRTPQFSEEENKFFRLYVTGGYPFIARDKSNEIFGYAKAPSKVGNGEWDNGCSWIKIPTDLFPSITFENSPFDAKAYLEDLK